MMSSYYVPCYGAPLGYRKLSLDFQNRHDMWRELDRLRRDSSVMTFSSSNLPEEVVSEESESDDEEEEDIEQTHAEVAILFRSETESRLIGNLVRSGYFMRNPPVSINYFLVSFDYVFVSIFIKSVFYCRSILC